tara:strand:- start:223 stop:1599 length:1377 start_codon:yes stop_codon:yes gene_type:complete
MSSKETILGNIDDAVLNFTVGKDVLIDKLLVDFDCIATVAHAQMLTKVPKKKPILSKKEYDLLLISINKIIKLNNNKKFHIRLNDQDIHMAIEKKITKEHGDLGKKIHTFRSRNDQIATDLRLYSKKELIKTLDISIKLINSLIIFGKKNKDIPMVGRTHMHPAMPSSVALWATAHVESLLDDCEHLLSSYDLNDQCPLGSAASYGVPCDIDRSLTSDLLGFSKPVHNVLYANNSRGKIESIILSSMSQIMLTLSRIAQDLLIFTMPEFDYFSISSDFCTGSSIMPQKNNLDICELIRAKSSLVKSNELAIYDIVKSSPSGYNRDLQEAKQPFIEGISTTISCLEIMNSLISTLKINKNNLINAFDSQVFATDRVLELVSDGKSFRDAYYEVKANLNNLNDIDPKDAIKNKTHLGAPYGLEWTYYSQRKIQLSRRSRKEKLNFEKKISKLLNCSYEIF